MITVNLHVRLAGMWIAAALFLLLAAGCETGGTPDVVMDDDGRARVGPAEVTATVTRAVAPGDRTLVLQGFRGTILLEGTTAQTANLEFTKRGLGGNEAEAQTSLSEVQVTEEGTPDEYTFRVESGDEPRTAADVRGTIPEGVSLRIEHISGAVSLLGVTGAVRVEHENGQVDVRGAESSVAVEIKNGDVRLHHNRLPGDATVSLTTENGDLEIAVPPDASAQVNAQTSAGEVYVRDLTFEPQRLTPLRAGARYTAQKGAGEAVVTLRTENGSIVIRGAEPILPAGRPVTGRDTTEAGATDAGATDADTVEMDTMEADTAASDTTRERDTSSDAEGPMDTGDANGPGEGGAQPEPAATPGEEMMPPPDSLDAPPSTPADSVLPDSVAG